MTLTMVAMLTFDLSTCMQFIWALVDRSITYSKEDFQETPVQWQEEKAICIIQLACRRAAICIAT